MFFLYSKRTLKASASTKRNDCGKIYNRLFIAENDTLSQNNTDLTYPVKIKVSVVQTKPLLDRQTRLPHTQSLICSFSSKRGKCCSFEADHIFVPGQQYLCGDFRAAVHAAFTDDHQRDTRPAQRNASGHTFNFTLLQRRHRKTWFIYQLHFSKDVSQTAIIKA